MLQKFFDSTDWHFFSIFKRRHSKFKSSILHNCHQKNKKKSFTQTYSIVIINSLSSSHKTSTNLRINLKSQGVSIDNFFFHLKIMY